MNPFQHGNVIFTQFMKVELERAVAIEDMQEKLILAYYALIWKFGPRPPKNDFFRKFLIFMERSLNFASNEPSTTPRH